ncbi:hypothetical protein [Paenibacillus paeoniae]|uniref:hypothetical protein n=1 Tax=Paenibacillus paeoniae TaxID=2292705 RepID=UPI001F0C48BA|nr:hypothetical protein [Paenibacillus paeoniae]
MNEAVLTEAWIIEGVHYNWGVESFKQADCIFLINPNKYVRNMRVIARFIRTRLGLEPSNYKQTFKNLYDMLFIWNRGFDNEGIKEILKLTEEDSEKRTIVKNNKEIMTFMQKYL